MSWVKRHKEDQRAAFLVERLFHRPEYALYDRNADPHEEQNLIGNPTHEQAFERLKKALHTRLRELEDSDPVATEEKLMAGEGRKN